MCFFLFVLLVKQESIFRKVMYTDCLHVHLLVNSVKTYTNVHIPLLVVYLNYHLSFSQTIKLILCLLIILFAAKSFVILFFFHLFYYLCFDNSIIVHSLFPQCSFVPRFLIEIETRYKNDNGCQENVSTDTCTYMYMYMYIECFC